jgi:hypothetical protein
LRLQVHTAAHDAANISAQAEADGAYDGTSFWNTVYQWGCIEGAIMVLFPGSDEARMIQEWRNAATNPNIVCTFAVLSITVITTLLLLYTQDRQQLIDGYACYDGGYLTLMSVLNCINAVCRTAGFVSDVTKHDDVQKIRRAVEAKWDPEGAPSFDFTDALLSMVKVAFNMSGLKAKDNKGWSLPKRVQISTQLVLCCAIMGRASDVTKFSPRMEDIKLPSRQSAKDWDPDSLPKWIDVTVWQSKGKRKRNKTRVLRIHRNPVKWELCPVFWLMFWFTISGIKEGPIFVKLSNKVGEVVMKFHEYRMVNKTECAFDVDGNDIGITYAQWAGALKKIWKVLDMEDLIPQSICKSAIKWAARCHGQDWEIKNNSGHSDTSTAWLR